MSDLFDTPSTWQDDRGFFPSSGLSHLAASGSSVPTGSSDGCIDPSEPRRETLDDCQRLIDAMWERLLSPLGGSVVQMLFKQALAETRQSHSVLEPLVVRSSGLSLLPVAPSETADTYRLCDVSEGVSALLRTVIDLVSVLTGEIAGQLISPQFHQQIASLTPGR